MYFDSGIYYLNDRLEKEKLLMLTELNKLCITHVKPAKAN